MGGTHPARVELLTPFSKRIPAGGFEISMKSRARRRNLRFHFAMIVFRELPQSFAMHSQAFLSLRFARIEFAEEQRNTLEVRGEPAFCLRDGPLQKLMPDGVKRRTNLL